MKSLKNENNYIKMAVPTQENLNGWVSDLKWVLRTIKKNTYDKLQEFVDYVLISYDVLPIFSICYKVERTSDSKANFKVSTWNAGQFIPDDNSYPVNIYVSLDLEPGTLGIGVSDKLEEKDFDSLASGVVVLIMIGEDESNTQVQEESNKDEIEEDK